jgi:hypothetical protein
MKNKPACSSDCDWIVSRTSANPQFSFSISSATAAIVSHKKPENDTVMMLRK